jgi:hypothetical protein
MTWNSVMGIISSIALFCPVLFVLALRLAAYSTFPALIVYYASMLIYNLMTEGYITVAPDVVRYWGMTNNLLDTPLMLFFLIHFSTSASFTRRIKILMVAFVLFEGLVVALKGFNREAITVILGPGILIILGLCVYFFIRQAKIAITHQKGTGKALIAAALLFAYGCFAIIYLMYYVFETPFIDDTFLVYFWVVTFSSLLLSAGLFAEEKRIRKLNELKTTRRELSDIYAGEKKAVPRRKTAMLDFDREQWN